MIDEYTKRINAIDRREKLIKQITGEYIYTDYKIWCIAYERQDRLQDIKNFKDYLNDENIVLTQYQKQCLNEKFGGQL